MSIEPPSAPKSAELALATVKGAVSAIPFVGGFAAELAALYLDPLKKRNEQWQRIVSEALNDLYARTQRLPEDLAKDDRFLSMLYHATATAWKNHQREKLQWLKSGLVSAGADTQLNEDTCFQYFRLVDELTVTHTLVLSGISRHIGQFSKCKSLESVYACFSKFHQGIARGEFRVLLEDLHARFLLRRGDLEDYPEYASKAEYIEIEESQMKELEMTDFGRGFLKFILEA